MAIILVLLLLLAGVAHGQPVPFPVQGGTINACSGGVACKADTLWVNETISCSGSPAVITGMAENLSISPYGTGNAQATVTGCGPAAAQNAVGGITVTAAGSGYAASPANIAGDYIAIGGGTPVNGSSFTGSITAGVLTITAMSTGQIYLGQVLTWSGSTGVTFIQDFVSGTGGVGTYNVAGTTTSLASTAITGTNRTVLRVLTVSSGTITAAGVVGGGQYSTAPGSPQSQTGTGGATSGSGSSATFTLTYIGLPISGTVASVTNGGFTFVSGVNAVTTYSNKSEQLAIGHPDDSAISATLAKNPGGMIFPTTVQPAWASVPLGYGFINPMTLPNTYRFSFICQGARIIALGSMNAQVTVPFQPITSLFFKPIIEDCEFQGMGITNYNLYLSAARYTVINSAMENAEIENVFIGDGNGDAAANVVLQNTVLHTDSNAVPAWPAYNYEQQASNDNQVCLMNADTAIWGNMLINGADDRVGCATHVFAVAAGPNYDIEATKTGINGIGDQPAPGQPCYYLNGSLTAISDWQCSLGNTYSGQYGIYVNVDQHSTIGCGIGANNAAWASNSANLVFFAVTQNTTRVAPCTGNGITDPAVFTGNLTVNGALSFTTCSQCGTTAPLQQSGLPFGVPPSSFMDANGNLVIGAAPATSATITFGATSGSTTATCSAACFSNSASDVNRVITVLDTTYKTCLITAQSSTTVATCTLSATLSGTGPFANANSWISGSGTAAQATGGGVTYPAAFSTTYSGGIYLYFSGVTAGPAQGIYYCVMASLATGVCYTTTYSTGNGTLTGASTPAIPGSPVQLSGVTSGTFTQTTGSAIILAQATLAANALGLNGCLDYDAGAVSTNSANNKTLGVRLNTSGPTNPMTTQPVSRISVKMCNNGANTSQTSIIEGTIAGSATGAMGVPTATSGVSRTSVGTNANRTVSFSINLAAATDNMVLEYYAIKFAAN